MAKKTKKEKTDGQLGLTKHLKSKHDITGIKRVEYWDSRYYQVQYTVNGQPVSRYFPSVTEILGAYPKDFMARWRGDVGNDRADQIIRDALQLGSFVHYGAEVIAKGGIVVYNPIEHPNYTEKEIDELRKKGEVCVCRFQKEFVQLHRIWQFFTVTGLANITTEQTVFSIEHEYAGTLDLMGTLEDGDYPISGSGDIRLTGGLYMFDYKTGKGISDTNKMQQAAYAKAVLESNPKLDKVFKGAFLLHTNAESTKAGIQGFKAHFLSKDEIDVRFDQFKKVQSVYLVNKPVPTPKTIEMPSILTLK